MLQNSLSFGLSLALLPILPALEVRSYSASRHDRFLDFPADPKINPDFLHASTDLTGVGWYLAPSNTTVERRRQYTLVSPRHFVGANHFRPSLDGQLQFLSEDGVVRTYGIASVQPVLNPNGDPSDLLLGTLETEVAPNDGVNFQPFLSVAEPSYLGQELIFMGHFRSSNPTLRAGRAVLEARTQFGRGTALGGDSGIERTEVFSWTFQENTIINTGNPDDSFTEPGDSGGPSLVDVNGRGALVGTHTAAGSARVIITNQNISYDTFLPFYVDGLNDLMADEGYHMTRAVPGPNQPNAPLALAAELPEVIRAGYPVTIPVTLSNTSAGVDANNLRLTVPVPTNSEATGTGDGWVTSSTAPGISARKGGLSAGEATVYALELTPRQPGTFLSEMAFAADESGRATEEIALTVVESYRSWSAELSDGSPTADSDLDGLTNLEEYAFGGDPMDHSRIREADGGFLLPTLEETPSGLVFNFLRRTDATERALAYVVESSPDLSAGSWEVVSPAATSAEASGAGFVRVRERYETSRRRAFFRMRVSLNE